MQYSNQHISKVKNTANFSAAVIRVIRLSIPSLLIILLIGILILNLIILIG